MRKQTDLEKAKEIARSFVYIDIRINKKTGFFVNHPYIGEVVTAIMQDGKLVVKDIRNETDLNDVRKNLLKVIDSVTEYQQFINIIRAPYLPAFFKHTKHLLCSDDYSAFLGTMWTIVEYPNIDENITAIEFVKLFRKADKSVLMDEDEFQQYLALPDEITVYRGIRARGSLKALSWTTDINKAKWFACRWNKTGKVYSAQISKEDVLAMFTLRGESELVVDFTKLKNIVLESEYH